MMDAGKLSGVIVVDKPPNASSAKVLASVKRILKAKKAGHTGTLDPLATGVLVCCFNRATKLARFFLHGKKKYQAVLHLGIETDTQDAAGDTIGSCSQLSVSEKEIRSACKQFEGSYEQTPPVYSALKHQGRPLYKYARSGKAVHKPPRRVKIDSIRVVTIDLPLVGFEVVCAAGTYIRTLCADIGSRLGCGGHLKELRRLESCGFRIDEAIGLSELQQMASEGKAADLIIPMAEALRNIPGYVANKVLTEKIKHGRVLYKNDLPNVAAESPSGIIKILDAHKNLIAVLGYHLQSDRLKYHCVFKNEYVKM